MKNLLAPTVIGLVAAISSVIVARLGIPVWVMFIGWIAFVAGGMSAKTAAPAFVCAVLGVIFGFVGAWIIGNAGGLGQDMALLLGVFVIVSVAVAAQGLPFANLVVCYFIGMTTFFASGLAPEVSTAVLLSSGLLAGVASGLIAVTIIGALAPKAAAEPA